MASHWAIMWHGVLADPRRADTCDINLLVEMLYKHSGRRLERNRWYSMPWRSYRDVQVIHRAILDVVDPPMNEENGRG